MLLLVSLLAPLAGPLLLQLLGRFRAFASVLDGFVIVLLGGLLGLFVLPTSIELLGWPAGVALLLGLAVPKALHMHDHAPPGRTVFVLALLALGLHAVLDGTALAASDPSSTMHLDSFVLALGVHRLLEGMSAWWILARYVGAGPRLVVMVLLTGTTSLGYLAGHLIVTAGLERISALFQVGVAGSLLHVLLWHPPGDEAACSLPTSRPPGPGVRLASLAGAAAAGAALLFLRMGHHHDGEGSLSLLRGTPILLRLAPTVIAASSLAFVCAALAHALGNRWPGQARKQGPISAALCGAVRGLFVPACSCGVVSLAKARRAEGHSPTYVLAYLTSAPAMGWVGFALSVVLLGVPLALLRALGSTLLAAGTAMCLRPHYLPADGKAEPAQAPPPRASASALLVDGVQFAGGEMVDFTVPWLTLGLVLATLLAAYVPAGSLTAFAERGSDVVLLSALAAPLYACAAAATLLGWSAVQAGASVGGVLALLWLASSLSIASTLAMARTFGALTAAFSVGLQVLLAAALATLVNWLDASTPLFALAVWPPDLGPGEALWPPRTWTTWAALAAIAVALWRQGLRGFVGQVLWANGPQEASRHHRAHSPCA